MIPAPRIYCILATNAPVAIVFRRGPSPWTQVLRWDLGSDIVEPGVWVRKRLYPFACDISSDGRLLAYLVDGHVERRACAFGGISRAPWLFPLVDWQESSSNRLAWTFADEPATNGTADPDPYVLPSGRRVWIKRSTRDAFLHLHHRNWRDEGGSSVQLNGPCLRKTCPVHGRILRRHGNDYDVLAGTDDAASLPGVVWADWDQSGRLLTATDDDCLRIDEVHSSSLKSVSRHDLSGMQPDPQPAPEWARSDVDR